MCSLECMCNLNFWQPHKARWSSEMAAKSGYRSLVQSQGSILGGDANLVCCGASKICGVGQKFKLHIHSIEKSMKKDVWHIILFYWGLGHWVGNKRVPWYSFQRIVRISVRKKKLVTQPRLGLVARKQVCKTHTVLFCDPTLSSSWDMGQSNTKSKTLWLFCWSLYQLSIPKEVALVVMTCQWLVLTTKFLLIMNRLPCSFCRIN